MIASLDIETLAENDKNQDTKKSNKNHAQTKLQKLIEDKENPLLLQQALSALLLYETKGGLSSGEIDSLSNILKHHLSEGLYPAR